MDKQRARELLTRYQPGAEKTDPQMAAALALARQDSQLAAWFATHSAAQAVAAQTRKKSGRDHIIPLNRPALALIGLAGAVLALSYFWPVLFPEMKNDFPAYRDRMARMVQRTYPMQQLLTNQVELRTLLRANGGDATFLMPRSLQALPAKGGAVITWHQLPVSLIAFDAPATPDLYLFVTKRAPFIKKTVPQSRQFFRVGRVVTATWLNNDQLFLLTGPTDEKTLTEFLDQP